MAGELVPASRVIPPQVPQHIFLISIWTTTGLALVFLLLRLYSRWRGTKKIYLDDYLILLAGVMILATAILWHWVADDMYSSLTAAGTHDVPLTPEFPVQIRKFLTVWGTAQVLYTTSLAVVKISFLVFFRRLGGHMERLRFVWWPVFGFTIASWAIMTGVQNWRCVFNESLEDVFAYCSTIESIEYTTISLKVSTAMDVISDFLILTIPFILLWGVQIPKKQKFVFIGLVSLTLVTMIISIARAVNGFITQWNTEQADTSYICLWTAVEPCAALIVACLTAFPQLFAPSSRPVYNPGGHDVWMDRQYDSNSSELDRGRTRGRSKSKKNKNIPTGGGGNRDSNGRGGLGGLGIRRPEVIVSVSYGHHTSRISQEPVDDRHMMMDDKSVDLGYMHGKGQHHHHRMSRMSSVSRSRESQLPIMGREDTIDLSSRPVSAKPTSVAEAVAAPAVAALYTRTKTSVNGKALL